MDDGRAAAAIPSGTVSFLFGEVAGDARSDAGEACGRILREAIVAAGGHTFKTIGVASCAAFHTPEAAVAAALEAQRSLIATGPASGGNASLRIALNTGTADERDGDYFGPALNRVARLLALAHGGQILLSNVTAALVRGSLPADAKLVDLGEHELDGIAGRERVAQLVAPGLTREFPKLRSRDAVAPWLVPEAAATRYFSGREDLLARMHRELDERGRLALSGLGGVGKTQAALAYALQRRAHYPGGVFWVGAETVGSLTTAFVEIARTLRLPRADAADEESTVRALTAWFERNERWLLILDNVEDRAAVRRFVPSRGAGHLVITSREFAFPEFGIPRALRVGDLGAAEAQHFLLVRTGREDVRDREAAAQLATELGALPLALEQAAAYITETGASFEAYVNAFRTRRVALLEKAAGLVSRDTVAVTWSANLEAVERSSPASAELLRISAMLAPDAIPFELFLGGAAELGEPLAEALAGGDELALLELLRPLGRYSLVQVDSASRTFGVHRLVQDVAWSAVPEGQRGVYAGRIAGALDATFPHDGRDAASDSERFLTHLAPPARWVDGADARPAAAARVFQRAGLYLWHRTRYAESAAAYARALELRERMHGPEHADVAYSLNGVALSLWYQGRYEEAQPLFERALKLAERTLGPDDPYVGQVTNNLANVHWARGRLAEALALYERAAHLLAGRGGAAGAEDPYLLGNIANIHFDMGNPAESVRLLERSSAILQSRFGPDHAETGTTMTYLAGGYAALGRHAEALQTQLRALDILERAFPGGHPRVAEALDGLAALRADEGRSDDALRLLERGLRIREETVGPDHPLAAESFLRLGRVHLSAGRRAEAEAALTRALAIQESAHGPEHSHIAASLLSLGALRKAQGRHDDAAAFYRRALAIKERILSEGHPELDEIRREAHAAAHRSSEDQPSMGGRRGDA